jgi:6-phosphogluconolactonase
MSAGENNWKYIYIGTYTGGDSEGIYLYKMNKKTGELIFTGVTEEVENPSFLAVDKTGKYLYAVKELTEFEGKKSGAVAAFSINPDTRELTFLNQKATGGGAPCHLTVDGSNNFVLAANYVGGNACAIKINDDGSLGGMTGFVQHTAAAGAGTVAGRQDAPHAHSVSLDSQNKYLYVADLGIDKLMIYKLNDVGKLSPNDPAYAELAVGAGPRHFVFHPDNKFAYVINELNSTLTSFKYNDKTGELKEINTETTLPDNFTGDNYCADIHVHPNGKYLYGSNRGHNSLVIFKINEPSGEVSLITHESSMGNWPRNFTIDPSGKFLIVANQKSNDIFVFTINNDSGILNYTGYSAKVPSPVCLVFDKN